MYKIENKEELMMLSGAGVGQGRDQSHELGLSMSRLMIMAGRWGRGSKGGKGGWRVYSSIPGCG